MTSLHRQDIILREFTIDQILLSVLYGYTVKAIWLPCFSLCLDRLTIKESLVFGEIFYSGEPEIPHKLFDKIYNLQYLQLVRPSALPIL